MTDKHYYTLEEVEGLSFDGVLAKFGITDDQARDSDEGGDSDEDDCPIISNSISSKCPPLGDTNRSGQTYQVVCTDVRCPPGEDTYKMLIFSSASLDWTIIDGFLGSNHHHLS